MRAQTPVRVGILFAPRAKFAPTSNSRIPVEPIGAKALGRCSLLRRGRILLRAMGIAGGIAP